MDFLSAVVLGLVEGITEFLPVSSTGHLILFNEWFAFAPDFTKMFDIVIQLGAILAVLVVFAKKLSFRSPSNFSLWKRFAVSVAPALVLGALFGSKIQQALFNPIVVAIALIIGGVILLIVERRKPKTTLTDLGKLSYSKAFAIGCIQCLAFIPGTSRSAATIVGAMLLGASRTAATEYSFFLAVPTLAAASAYSLLKNPVSLSGNDMVILTIGFITAFFSALVVIRLFLQYIRNKTFAPFAYYRIALGIVILFFFAQ